MTFEQFLQDYFQGLGEVGGMPITKDSYEDMFDSWLENKDVSEIMKLAEMYGKSQYIMGKEDVINKLS